MSPFFLRSTAGNIFVNTFFSTKINDTSPYVLILPPFAEENNKSRRMLSCQARLLNELGYHVVLPDLYGTGDSEGDFSQATWNIWCQDIKNLVTDLAQKKKKVVAIIALRLGALLATSCAQYLGESLKLMVFWQPLIKGESGITQFLRVKMAADLATGEEKTTPSMLREELRSGELIEVAGYSLLDALTASIDELKMLATDFPSHVNVAWFDVAISEGRNISPANQKIIKSLEEKNICVVSEVVAGPQFWQSVEIEEAPKLLMKTSELFEAPL